ncbi:serine-rich adhesin for platelets-like [Chrysoperla carnea]|uniref:serine-rich adhesin for platelets-like n=1 Tax=Chrysoperla carnea TaxID=189513 RepID=UPI001D09031B|nr:serine-rich adhesin for platelets-like [Chrysoperla carnea]
METWIKTEDNENTWEFFQHQAMNCKSKFEDDFKSQSMLITFSTEHNARKIYNTEKEKIELKSLPPNIIVNIPLDEKLRMTPIVKLEKLEDNPVISNNKMPPSRKYSKKCTKPANSEIPLKPPRKKVTVNTKKSKIVVKEINLQSYKNCALNTYCEKSLDTVTEYQIKGNFNISKSCDLYANDCCRATNTSDLLCNDQTKNLMKSDFDQLWQEQEEEANCDPSNELSSQLFSSRKRRQTRRLSSESSSPENIPNIPKLNKKHEVSKKCKLSEKANNSMQTTTTSCDVEDLDSKDVSSSESVLSNCKIFDRRSDTSSVISETSTSKSKKNQNKIKLCRSSLYTTKNFRKKQNTNSNIFIKTLPRITSNHLLFNQSSVLAEEEIDLENLSSVNSEPQTIQVTVYNESRSFVNEPLKTHLLSNEKPAKRINDLREMISPKYFEVKRPPNRPSSICSFKRGPVNNLSPFTSNSSNSFLPPPPPSYQQANDFQQEDDVISLFAESVIVNTSPPRLDQDFDDVSSDDDMSNDNNFSQNCSSFSGYDIDERVPNGNCTVTESDVNRNKYLDNISKTNSMEKNLFQTGFSSLDTFPKIMEPENTFEKNIYTTERDNNFRHMETASTSVPSSTDFNTIDKVPKDSLCNGINRGFVVNSPKISSPAKTANISQDISCTINNPQFIKSNSFSNQSSPSFSPFKPLEVDEIAATDLNSFISNSDILQNIRKTNESTPNNSKSIKMSPHSSPHTNINNIVSQTNAIKKSPNISNSTLVENSDHTETANDEFRAFFRTVCFHYLEYGFCGTTHSEKHEIPSGCDKVLQKLSPSQISFTYNTFVYMVRHLQKLKAVKPNVKVSCMKSILDALNDFMEYHVAIDKIFEDIAKKDTTEILFSTIDILLELLLEEPSIENNWNSIKKLTSVKDYEIPLKTVETILRDCCNRLKIRKFYVKNVFNDVIKKIADVNLLKIKTEYIDDFVKIIENFELNCVDEFKNRLTKCRENEMLMNDAMFKVPAPIIKKISSTSTYITTTLDTNTTDSNIPPLISNSGNFTTPPVSNSGNVTASTVSNSGNYTFNNSNDGDRYSPTTSTNIRDHQRYKPRPKSKQFHGKNMYKQNKNKMNYHLSLVVRDLRNGDFTNGLEKLRYFRQRPDFQRIVNDIAKQLSPETAQRLLNVYKNGSNYKDKSRYNYHEYR